ncbi:ribonuclease Z [Massilia solisilvae]|uniref:Ribonuclease Z n=1 Tax=Massilia solisilvae TaxID=1811225 RepID=A0ABT2BHE7_9BURK|nr:ribonuclease Z [Massilia solisilvae]MCS0607934.1 ribonuclease Z [Massilia solisilvae]
MELEFLGTSSGTPTKTRNVSALALRSPLAARWYLVDCGEGTQHRLLHTSLSLMGLRAIFITHVHGDHCYGLPGLLASAGLLNRTDELLLVGPAAIAAFVQGVMETTQLALPYPVAFLPVEQGIPDGLLPDFEVRVTALSHRVPSYAYTFIESKLERKLDAGRLRADGVPRGPAWGELQRGGDVMLPDGRVLRAQDYLQAPRKPRKIIVGGDNDTPELLADQAGGADVLVHEATYTEDILEKVGPAPQHSTARRTARFAADANIPNLVLTHFSPRYQQHNGPQTIADVEREARAAYRGNLFLANDLDRFSLDRQGRLSRIAPAG